MKKFILASFICFCFSSHAQTNLVLNPGFEFTTSCPAGAGGWNACADWDNLNLNTGTGYYGSPDYFHPCGNNNTAPPATFAGTCNPHTGNAMMALVVYNWPFPDYREYVQTALSQSMQPGTTYTLSFWITNGTGIKSPWTIANMGVCFSTGSLTQSGYAIVNGIPQCEVTSNIVDTNWVQYTFTVNPTAAWDHMTIGAFRPDVSNNPTMSFADPGGNPSVYANYFIDDIAVLKPCATSPSLAISASSHSLCQGAFVTLSAIGSSNYTWSPASSLSSSGGTVVSANPSITTVYTISAFDGFCPSFTTTTVTVVANPTLVVTSSTPSLCSPGGSVNLTAGGASSYTWISAAALSSSTGINVSANISATSTFSLNGSANNCIATSVLTIAALPQPTLMISGPAQFLCRGQAAALAALGAASYSWSTGQTSTLIIVSPPSTSVYTVTGTNTQGCSKKAVYTVSVSICEGLNSQNADARISLFPNPAKDFVFIECSDLSVWKDLIIIDCTGKVVKRLEQETFEDFNGTLKIDLSALDKGIYFFKGNYQGKELTYKLVKE